MPSRRTYLRSCVGVASVPLVAGCSALSSPDPTVTETRVDDGFDALFGGTDIFVTVANEGGAGDVRVTLKLLDSEGTVLFDESQVEPFEADERKRITFTVEDVPDGTEELAATAEAA